MSEGPVYRAPALEKGLDIIELIAAATTPLTLAQISERLGRSKGEIFRMMQVLEERGYITRPAALDGYRLTNRLFMLGMTQPPVRNLLESALPAMRLVAEETWQSCHLVVASDEEIVVIARVDSPSDLGYAVRVGHRRPVGQSASGAVLFAFQPPSAQQAWLGRLFDSDSAARRTFLERVKEVKALGYARTSSPRVQAVTDLSVPLMQDGRAIATMVMPFMEQEPAKANISEATACLLHAVAQANQSLQFGVPPGLSQAAPAVIDEDSLPGGRKRSARRIQQLNAGRDS